jgi:hypothetical protein
MSDSFESRVLLAGVSGEAVLDRGTGHRSAERELNSAVDLDESKVRACFSENGDYGIAHSAEP